MPFHDRADAGRRLALRLLEWAADGDITDPVVLALPRGGVPVAAPVSEALRAPLDVLVARKIGLPGQPEAGIGAIAGDDPPVFDYQALRMLGMTEDEFASDVARERAELHRREDLYRRGRPAHQVTGKTVILVDDGLATGVTARAALRHLRRRYPARLILAVPVGGAATTTAMRDEADDVVCLEQPWDFYAVGQVYEDFTQVSDEEVTAALRAAKVT